MSYLFTFIAKIIFVLTVFHFQETQGCGKSIGQNAGEALESGLTDLGAKVQYASDQLSSSLDRGVDEIGNTVRSMASSVETLAKSVNIKINSEDFANMGDAATKNLALGMERLSENWKLAINTADMKEFGAEASRHLSSALQNLKLKLEIVVGMDDNTLTAVRHLSDQLSQSLDKGVDELGNTVRSMASSVETLAKSVNLKINSGDLANMGDAATRNLALGMEKLSENWELAIKTSDLKDVGAEASRHLSSALQNLKLKLEIVVGMDDNTVTAVGYLSIAGGIAFSVLFIAILISLRQCRSCTVALFKACISLRSNCRNDEEKPVTDAKVNEKMLKETNQSNNRDAIAIYEDIPNEGGSNKRFTKSLSDYDGFLSVKSFWNRSDE